MAEQTVDQILDGGASSLQYFKAMLDIAKWLSNKTWPDWRDHVCRNYDNERGIDLASLRGDAVMLRQQATAARQVATDQTAARTSVQTAWPDNAGRAAVTTLDAHQKRSDPMATTLDKVATAAEAIPDAIVSAVRAKTDGLREFESKEADAGVWAGVMKVAGVVVPGLTSVVELNADSRERFEAQLTQDLARFDQVVATTVAAIQAAYATVPAAAKGIDVSAFPAPSFGSITGTTTEKPGGPTTVSPVSGGGGGGGSPTTSSPSSTTPTTTSPTLTSPTSTSPTSTSPTSTSPTSTSPTSTSPTGASPTTPTTTSPAATTPSSATPSAGTGAGKDSGSSWLSQLLPKIAEQLGLGGKDKTGDGTDADKESKDGKDAKDARGEKVLGTDALGRTVTASLGPDGKTVEVTAKKPDGTTEKVTLKVGEDGTLTPVDGKDGAGKDGAGKDGAGKDGAGKDGAGKDGDAKPDGTVESGKPGGATPAAGNGPTTATPPTDRTGSGGGAAASGAGATPAGGGATPSTAGPGVVAPPAAPAKPSTAGGQNPAPAEEPCPPEAPAEQGTGAEFAVSGT